MSAPIFSRPGHGTYLIELRNGMKVSGPRRFSSTALDCAYVACGRTDGYWEDSAQIWHMAVGR
ncbi:inositol monophosphatase family protein [Bartonella raoultii]|uniref:inositol monophosphatase family protein n=1 Tax=Bartonella raoultii TaxID=1457020 RepID=UPI001ABA7397